VANARFYGRMAPVLQAVSALVWRHRFTGELQRVDVSSPHGEHRHAARRYGAAASKRTRPPRGALLSGRFALARAGITR